MIARRSWIVAVTAIIALVLGALVAAILAQRSETTRYGQALLALSLPDPAGKERSLAEWRGKVLVVNFWATWCGPCREEIPLFVAAQTRDGARGLQVVGIAVDDAAKVRRFIDELGFNYPVLIGGYGALELSRTLGNSVMALPFTVVLSREGSVVATRLGPFSDDQLAAIIRQVL